MQLEPASVTSNEYGAERDTNLGRYRTSRRYSIREHTLKETEAWKRMVNVRTHIPKFGDSGEGLEDDEHPKAWRNQCAS